MIDDIVEMILKEARGRNGKDIVFQAYRVMREVDTKIINMMDKHREEKRRIKEDENKG